MNSNIDKFKSLIDELIKLEIKNENIFKIKFKLEDKIYTIDSLTEENLYQLYEYFNSFNKIEKEYFGFPLFTPIRKNYVDFQKSYKKWLEEKDNWNVFMLYREDVNKIIAMSYIKKMNFINSIDEEYKSPTWFNSVKAKYRILKIKKNKNLRLSYLMGLVVLMQAEYKKLKSVYARGRSNNKAVENYILSLGYKKTGRKFVVKKENVTFEDIEYEATLN